MGGNRLQRRNTGAPSAFLLAMMFLGACGGGTSGRTNGTAGAAGGGGGTTGGGAGGGGGSIDGGVGDHGGADSSIDASGIGGAPDAGDAGGRDAGGDDGASGGFCGGSTGGTDAGAGNVAMVGDSCGHSGDLGCDGPAQKTTLICSGGGWRNLSTCDATQNCDRTSGVCTDIVPGCLGSSPGYTFCSGDLLQTCGPDLVSVTTATCCGNCVSGRCQPVSCGDGKVEAGEECDDGNTTPADGCEPDCKLSKVLRLAAGADHTCALLREGLVRCWGANDQGQLGLGTSVDMTASAPYQIGLVQLGAPAAAIAAGRAHTCALMQDGSLRCWGTNEVGQLGLGHTRAIGDNEVPSAENAAVPLGAPVTAVAAGGDVTCAIMQDGTLRCWGQNNYGQLGLGNTNNIGDDETPSAGIDTVILDDTVTAVGPGGQHTCAVMSSNAVRCWGRNNLGQLGIGNTTNIGDDEPPTAVAAIVFPGATPFGAIMAGATRTFAWEMDGSDVRGWGDNSDYGLGVANAIVDPDMLATAWGAFSFSTPVQEIAVGGYHICVRFQDHELRCWGINTSAQLGQPNLDTIGDNEQVITPPPVDLGTDAQDAALYATALASGAAHSCALLNTGAVRCWGLNSSGQLGLGYASVPPMATTYVGGTAGSVPGKLPYVQVFPPTP